MARVRIPKGSRRRKRPDLGRKPGRQHKLKNPSMDQSRRAIQKAATRFENCEILNSYFVGQDGQYVYYEVIMKAVN